MSITTMASQGWLFVVSSGCGATQYKTVAIRKINTIVCFCVLFYDDTRSIYHAKNRVKTLLLDDQIKKTVKKS